MRSLTKFPSYVICFAHVCSLIFEEILFLFVIFTLNESSWTGLITSDTVCTTAVITSFLKQLLLAQVKLKENQSYYRMNEHILHFQVSLTVQVVSMKSPPFRLPAVVFLYLLCTHLEPKKRKMKYLFKKTWLKLLHPYISIFAYFRDRNYRWYLMMSFSNSLLNIKSFRDFWSWFQWERWSSAAKSCTSK